MKKRTATVLKVGALLLTLVNYYLGILVIRTEDVKQSDGIELSLHISSNVNKTSRSLLQADDNAGLTTSLPETSLLNETNHLPMASKSYINHS